MPEVWFWQRIVTPHMMGLASALSKLKVKVTYVAQQRMSADRKQQGWLEPESCGVEVVIAKDKQSVCQLVTNAPEQSVHICQGIRANGLVSVAQHALQMRDLTQWVVMETVRDVGWRGVIKRFEYARLFRKKRSAIAGVLSTGYRTSEWVIQRGFPAEKVFPFAYFLDKSELNEGVDEQCNLFKFIFVGQFIPLKRLDWLITALGELSHSQFELVVIGSGPLEESLRHRAETILGGSVNWVGRLPSNEVREHLAVADCLVLPSLYDGWGAVVSEALMCGTPVICSDTCGSAGIVEKSGVGGVFNTDSHDELVALLNVAIKSGCVTHMARRNTSAWSDAIAAVAGAQYLRDILTFQPSETERPQAPWTRIGEV